MKPTSPAQILSDQLWQLHCMEIQIARALPALAANVMYAPLSRLLSHRAMDARGRRQDLEDLLQSHAQPLATKTPDPIGRILADGNKDLARIRNSRSRDVATIEHCMRIEQHATTAYGVAVPLTHRIGFPEPSDRLRLLLGDLETARFSFRALEAEVFSIAARAISTPSVRAAFRSAPLPSPA